MNLGEEFGREDLAGDFVLQNWEGEGKGTGQRTSKKRLAAS